MSDHNLATSDDIHTMFETLQRISEKLATISEGIAKIESVSASSIDRIDKLTRHVEKTSVRLSIVEQMHDGWHDIVSLLQTIESQVSKTDDRLHAIESSLDRKQQRLENLEKRLYKDEEVLAVIEKQLVHSNKNHE